MSQTSSKYKYVIAYIEGNKTTLFFDMKPGRKGEDDISGFIPFPDSSKTMFEMLYPCLNWKDIQVGYRYWVDNESKIIDKMGRIFFLLVRGGRWYNYWGGIMNFKGWRISVTNRGKIYLSRRGIDLPEICECISTINTDADFEFYDMMLAGSLSKLSSFVRSGKISKEDMNKLMVLSLTREGMIGRLYKSDTRVEGMYYE